MWYDDEGSKIFTTRLSSNIEMPSPIVCYAHDFLPCCQLSKIKAQALFSPREVRLMGVPWWQLFLFCYIFPNRGKGFLVSYARRSLNLILSIFLLPFSIFLSSSTFHSLLVFLLFLISFFFPLPFYEYCLFFSGQFSTRRAV